MKITPMRYVTQVRKPLQYSVLLYSVYLLAHGYAVSPIGFGGGFLLTGIATMAISVAGVAVLSLPIVLIFLIFRRSRKKAISWFWASLIYIMVGGVALFIAPKVRMYGFQKLAARSQPVITAIKAYERQYHEPPPTLRHLVPEFLSEVPSTGMPAYPHYLYVLAASDDRLLGGQWPPGNTWALYVLTPWGMYFDKFLYLPQQNYPEYAYSAVWERVDTWAYGYE